MSGPIGNAENQGDGADQFKALMMRWIRDEIGRASQGGANGSLHIDGATGNLVVDRGDIRSGNYVSGTSGWDLAPDGAAELGQTTVRGGKIQSGNFVAGTSGWGLDGAGNAEFNTVTLRAGIIGNAALANPVTLAVANANVNGIAVALTWTDYTPLTFVVPSGFTSCAIMASLSASPYVTSPGGASGAVQVRVAINGTTGAKGDSGWLVAGDQRSVSANFALSLTGLVGGGSVIVKSQAIATAGSPNMDYLNLSAIAVFTR